MREKKEEKKRGRGKSNRSSNCIIDRGKEKYSKEKSRRRGGVK